MAHKLIILLTVLIGLLIVACGGKKENTELKQNVLEKAKKVFAVLPDKMPGSENDTPERIALGKKLYFDANLSVDGSQSCNSCHDITNGNAGVDNLPVSPGALGEDGTRNSPTVLNAGFQFVQFWDGREPDLKAQAGGPILNPIEMAMPSKQAVEVKLRNLPEYQEDFEVAFPGSKQPISFDNITEVIAAFERTLITHDRFDDFLRGDLSALSETEVKGLDLFITMGCITCHTGALLGGNMYQKMGLVKAYEDTVDTGRHMVTKNEADKFMFKVPTLRNIALTDPYFHEGAEESLKEAIKRMADMQLAKELTNLQTLQIEKFLNTLTDKELAAAQKN